VKDKRLADSGLDCGEKNLKESVLVAQWEKLEEGVWTMGESGNS